MAFMLRSHNGVHCCGTVGDSHSHSQLSAVKHTFTGNSFQNHDARTVQTESHQARLNGQGAARSRKFICKDSANRAKNQILFEFFRDTAHLRAQIRSKIQLFHESSCVFLIFFRKYVANLINFSKYECYDNHNSAIITIFAQKIARRYSRSAK